MNEDVPTFKWKGKGRAYGVPPENQSQIQTPSFSSFSFSKSFKSHSSSTSLPSYSKLLKSIPSSLSANASTSGSSSSIPLGNLDVDMSDDSILAMLGVTESGQLESDALSTTSGDSDITVAPLQTDDDIPEEALDKLSAVEKRDFFQRKLNREIKRSDAILSLLKQLQANTSELEKSLEKANKVANGDLALLGRRRRRKGKQLNIMDAMRPEGL